MIKEIVTKVWVCDLCQCETKESIAMTSGWMQVAAHGVVCRQCKDIICDGVGSKLNAARDCLANVSGFLAGWLNTEIKVHVAEMRRVLDETKPT